jgi:predicted DNA-binding transcriptional regulator AlpA
MSRRLRTPEAVERSGLSRRTLYKHAQDGLLTRWKVGAVTFWSVDELDALARPARGGDAA